MGEPEVRERGKIQVVAEDVLRALELVELNEKAASADIDVQRIEAFLLRQTRRRHVGVREWGQPEIDECLREGLAAQTAAGGGAFVHTREIARGVYHVFHGPRPVRHSSSRWRLSRRV